MANSVHLSPVGAPRGAPRPGWWPPRRQSTIVSATPFLLLFGSCSGAPASPSGAEQTIERAPAPPLPPAQAAAGPRTPAPFQPELDAFPTSPSPPPAPCRVYEFEQSTPPPPEDEFVAVEQPIPSVFYLMLDRSGSMNEAERTSPRDALSNLGRPALTTPWSRAVNALTSFFEDPQSAGLQLALNYFPGPGECNGDGYATPNVPLGAVPEHAPALIESLLTQSPDGFTPMEGALRGATRFCIDYRQAHPAEACVAIVLTDGAPTRCSVRSAEQLAAIAQDARQQGVLTFAAGMEGADFGVLEAIAQAGGGDCNAERPEAACDLSASPEAFLLALTRIRDTVRTQVQLVESPQPMQAPPVCTWTLSEAGDAQKDGFELTLETDLQPPVAMERLPSVEACGQDREGWVLQGDLEDSNAAIAHLCPYSCSRLRQARTSSIEVTLPCAESVALR